MKRAIWIATPALLLAACGSEVEPETAETQAEEAEAIEEAEAALEEAAAATEAEATVQTED